MAFPIACVLSIRPVPTSTANRIPQSEPPAISPELNKVPAEQPLDDRGHQRRLRGRNGRRADAEHAVQVQRRHSDHERRCHHADDQADLLINRRRADQISSLQILRRPARVGGRDADDRADADRNRRINIAGPPQRDEEQAREDERRDRHA